MNEKKNKFLILGITIGLIILTSSFIFLTRPTKKENKKLLSEQETKNMLSYTLDGQKTDIKPTKGSGYIANKITCENGSNLIWDNTNWEVEIISLESSDICTVDFTTNASTSGYRITAITNVEGSIDSLSKSTIENGTIIFYPSKGQEITGVSGCSNGKLENNKVIVSNITSNQTCNITIHIPLKTLYTTLSDGKKYKLGERGTFDRPWGESSVNTHATITQGYNQTGTIYKTEDNKDYYFAGNPSDNWVKFAGLWWRIIRTNSTEGTRLLYAGTSHDGQDGYINNTTYKWYRSYNNANYVQWSYAANTIGNALTSWYSSNISSYENMVNTDIEYCNDTSVASTSGSTQYFGAHGRLVTNKTPSYTCVTNSNSTHRSIGLMTADEVAFAGGERGYNSPNTYYYRNSTSNGCTGVSGDPCSATGDNYWWTMSPYYFSNSSARVFHVVGAGDYPGQLSYGVVSSSDVVRPVITLKLDVKVTGSGTTDDPFIPSLAN